jgi:hypothetical protein
MICESTELALTVSLRLFFLISWCRHSSPSPWPHSSCIAKKVRRKGFNNGMVILVSLLLSWSSPPLRRFLSFWTSVRFSFAKLPEVPTEHHRTLYLNQLWFCLSYFFFVLILFLTLAVSNALVSFVATIVPDFSAGATLATAICAYFFLFAGFFILRYIYPYISVHMLLRIRFPHLFLNVLTWAITINMVVFNAISSSSQKS